MIHLTEKFCWKGADEKKGQEVAQVPIDYGWGDEGDKLERFTKGMDPKVLY